MFIRIEISESRHEWGFESDWVPCIGDVLWLFYEKPDTEPTGNDYIEGVVVKRQPILDEPIDEVWLTVVSDSHIPEGYIADSSAWPSSEYSQRKQKLEADLKRWSDRLSAR